MSTLDPAAHSRSSRTAAEWLWPLLPIGVSVFSLSALVYFHLYHDRVRPTSILQEAIAAIYRTFGLAPSVLFFLLALTWCSIWFATGKFDRPLVRLSRLLAMAVMLGVFLNLGDGGVTPAFHKGQVGAWLAGGLVSAIGYLPAIVLVWAVTFAALLLATDFFFSDSFERLRVRSPAFETGVEDAVTDHLRGLGTQEFAGKIAPRDAASPLWSDDGIVADAEAPSDTRRPESPDAYEDENPLDLAAAIPIDVDAPPSGGDVEAAGGAPPDPELVHSSAAESEGVLRQAPAGEFESALAAPLDSGATQVGGDPVTGDLVEPIVDIPRPDLARTDARGPRAADEAGPRQQGLFAPAADEGLIGEAIELVAGARRVTAALLQRRLRIDYAQALDLMAQLAARGVVELEADASQGRVVV